MFRQGNAPPPASKKFVSSLEDIQLVNDEGTKIKYNFSTFCATNRFPKHLPYIFHASIYA